MSRRRNVLEIVQRKLLAQAGLYECYVKHFRHAGQGEAVDSGQAATFNVYANQGAARQKQGERPNIPAGEHLCGADAAAHGSAVFVEISTGRLVGSARTFSILDHQDHCKAGGQAARHASVHGLKGRGYCPFYFALSPYNQQKTIVLGPDSGKDNERREARERNRGKRACFCTVSCAEDCR